MRSSRLEVGLQAPLVVCLLRSIGVFLCVGFGAPFGVSSVAVLNPPFGVSATYFPS
jgi:hypothetical protein